MIHMNVQHKYHNSSVCSTAVTWANLFKNFPLYLASLTNQVAALEELMGHIPHLCKYPSDIATVCFKVMKLHCRQKTESLASCCYVF